MFCQPVVLGGFYGFLSNALKILSLSEDGSEIKLVMLASRNYRVQTSQIDGNPRTHDETALSGAEVLVVARQAFIPMELKTSNTT